MNKMQERSERVVVTEYLLADPRSFTFTNKGAVTVYCAGKNDRKYAFYYNLDEVLRLLEIERVPEGVNICLITLRSGKRQVEAISEGGIDALVFHEAMINLNPVAVQMLLAAFIEVRGNRSKTAYGIREEGWQGGH